MSDSRIMAIVEEISQAYIRIEQMTYLLLLIQSLHALEGSRSARDILLGHISDCEDYLKQLRDLI